MATAKRKQDEVEESEEEEDDYRHSDNAAKRLRRELAAHCGVQGV